MLPSILAHHVLPCLDPRGGSNCIRLVWPDDAAGNQSLLHLFISGLRAMSEGFRGEPPSPCYHVLAWSVSSPTFFTLSDGRAETRYRHPEQKKDMWVIFWFFIVSLRIIWLEEIDKRVIHWEEPCKWYCNYWLRKCDFFKWSVGCRSPFVVALWGYPQTENPSMQSLQKSQPKFFSQRNGKKL
jgi:hypothetical protein